MKCIKQQETNTFAYPLDPKSRAGQCMLDIAGTAASYRDLVVAWLAPFYYSQLTASLKYAHEPVAVLAKTAAFLRNAYLSFL